MQSVPSTAAPQVLGSLPKQKRRRSGARERLRALWRACGQPMEMALGAFLLPLVEWFSIPSSFACALLLAVPMAGMELLFPLLGLAASLLFRLMWNLPLDLWQYAACMVAALSAPLLKKSRLGVRAALAALLLLPRCVFTLAAQGTALDFWRSLAALPIALGAPFVLARGVDVLARSRFLLSGQDKACAALLLSLIVSALGYFRIGPANLGIVIAIVLTLVSAYVMGMAGGAVGGLLCGIALCLCGHDPRLLLELACGGLFAGICRLPKKRCFSVLLLLGGGVAAWSFSAAPSPATHWSAAALGCGLFLLTGGGWIERAKSLLLATLPAAQSMDNAFVHSQLQRWEKALAEMAQSLPEVEETANSEQELYDLLRHDLCAGCGEKGTCWDSGADAAHQLFSDLVHALFYDPGELQGCIAEHRGSGCIRLHRVEETAQSVMRELQARQYACRRACQERSMTATHLRALAQTITRTREMIRGETLSDLQAVYQINKAIRDLHFPAELCYARRVDGRLLAALQVDGLPLAGKQPAKLLNYLAQDQHLLLRATRMEKGRLELEEAPVYAWAVGQAGICAGETLSRRSERESGDTTLCQGMGCGRCLLALSDGMGHGPRAHRQSQKTLELYHLCLEAGYTHPQAVAAVNGMMLSTAVDESYATMDLFDIDLWTGEVISQKLGAVASYVVRGNYLKLVRGSSLPLGIVENIAATEQRFRLHSGDLLVVLSDGVTDVFPDTQALEAAILDSLYVQPQRMADALLRSALLATGGVPADDMTVLTFLLYDQNRTPA